MKSIIQKLKLKLLSSETDVQNLTKYLDMKQHPGWAVHVALLIEMRNHIMEDMLRERFTKLDAVEKDVRQRAYAQVNDVLEFLINPVADAYRMGMIRKHNQMMERPKREARQNT